MFYVINTLTIAMYDADQLVPIADQISPAEAASIMKEVAEEGDEVKCVFAIEELLPMVNEKLGVSMTNDRTKHVVLGFEDEAIVVKYNGSRLREGEKPDPSRVSFYYVQVHSKTSLGLHTRADREKQAESE